jgi:RNA-directed DNA polymerase
MYGLEASVLQAIRKSELKSPARLAKRTKVIVFADDFLILAPTEETLNAGTEGAKTFLNSMGLKLNQNKTKVTHTTTGFEYLGCVIKQQEVGKRKRPRKHHTVNITWRVKILPSQKNINKHFSEIRKQMKSCGDLGTLIRKLNPIIKGFKQFASYTDAGTYGKASQWSTQLYLITSNWLRNRFNIRGKDPRVYTRHRGREWMVYVKDGNIKRYLEKYYLKGDNYGLNRHIKVRGDKSPYDGDWAYWGKRTTTNTEISGLKLALLKKQRGRCAVCSGPFTPNDTIQTDHIIPRTLKRAKGQGGGENLCNLQVLHQECHEQKSKKDKKNKAE